MGFIQPFSMDDSLAYWSETVRSLLLSESSLVLGGLVDEHMIGTVQLNYNTPPNQPHRADINKLLVHPEYRRHGIARMLMEEIEKHAIRRNRTLLTLDTANDHAARLYDSLGYQRVGVIPGYARDPIVDRNDDTLVMFKKLND